MLLTNVSQVFAESNWTANPILPFLNITGPNQLDGVNINPNTAAAGNFTNLTASGTTRLANVATQSQAFSTAIAGNPLILGTLESIPVASVNAANGQVVLTGVAGRTIYPIALTLMVNGTAASATSEKVYCSPSTRSLGTFPVGILVSGVPVNVYSTSATAGIAMGNGCALNDSIYLSNVGSALTTTTILYPTLLYTVQ